MCRTSQCERVLARGANSAQGGNLGTWVVPYGGDGLNPKIFGCITHIVICGVFGGRSENHTFMIFVRPKVRTYAKKR
jgi:hypothetical protein